MCVFEIKHIISPFRTISIFSILYNTASSFATNSDFRNCFFVLRYIFDYVIIIKMRFEGDFLMFCGKCGNSVRDGALFCPKCGRKFSLTTPYESVSTENSKANPTSEVSFATNDRPYSSENGYATPAVKVGSDDGTAPTPLKKKSVAPLIILIVVCVAIIVGGVFGFLFLFPPEKNDDAASSQVSAPAVIKPEEFSGRWEYNVSYTDFPVGKAIDTAFDTQFSEVRYRLSIEFYENSKAQILLYKADIESASVGVFEILRSYRVNEFYQSYYNADGLAKEDVEHLIFEREHMTVNEYVEGQMKSVGIDQAFILENMTANLRELDGRTWIYMDCKYSVGDGVIHLQNDKGENIISFVLFTDENKITPYEANDTFSFLVKSPGEEISFLKKNK